AILYGLDDFPEVNPEIRAELNNIFETKGLLPLQIQLKELDLETYNSIKIDNPRRVIRALEICLSTGNKFSFYKNKPKAKRNFIPIIIGLEAEREIIYKRINKRVDLMINNGLLHEAKKLYPNKNLNALQTVGYQELFNFFDGKYSLEFAINEIKKNTRRFAKRQITWNKKYQDIQLFNYAVPHKEIIQFLEGKMKND
ncbi:MAG: tRNA (adenosine(37)-N6)-dimethylallyltransferase, partial [Lutibacter sp.]